MTEYMLDPCRASSLPYWKTESIVVPEAVTIVRDDLFSASQHSGKDEPYFKMLHDLKAIQEPVLPEGYEIAPCGIDGFVEQICACYTYERLSAEELLTYQTRPVYRPDLWLAVADRETGKIVATGIAELDARIGEGVLEWIQVLPEARRKGLGSFLVNELLKRMRKEARFVTVSGRLKSESSPYALYRACGFTNPVIWHIVTG